jgi:phosphonate transport system ATP-binding protein
MTQSPPVDHAVAIDHLVCRVGARMTLKLETLRLRHGERVAIVGPNGAGKSTLLRVLSGFQSPAAGRVNVLGQDLGIVPGRAPPRRALRELRCDIGQVLQGLHLVKRLSVIENVLVGVLGRQRGWAAWRSWWRLYDDATRARANRALRAVGLAGRESERTDRLSGGERQKVALARMLMQQPRLILADEPTASLDPAAAQEICALLVQAARGATLVSVLHNTALLPLLADRVLGLQSGTLAFDVPVADLDDDLLASLYRADDAPRVETQAMPPRPAELGTQPCTT